MLSKKMIALCAQMLVQNHFIVSNWHKFFLLFFIQNLLCNIQNTFHICKVHISKALKATTFKLWEALRTKLSPTIYYSLLSASNQACSKLHWSVCNYHYSPSFFKCNIRIKCSMFFVVGTWNTSNFEISSPQYFCLFFFFLISQKWQIVVQKTHFT